MKKILADLTNDIIVYKKGLYTVKRYSYNKDINFVDENYKNIKERVFSFILHRGEKWFNHTHRNFRESELHLVESTYDKIINEITLERKEKLTLERKIRKQFPIKHEFVFENVKLVAIERPCYYYDGFKVVKGYGFEPKNKIVELFFNGHPFRKNVVLDINETVNIDLLLTSIDKEHNQPLFNYSKIDFNKTKYIKEYSKNMGYELNKF